MHVTSEIKSRLESKVTDLQDENTRLREENAALRSRVQEIELGLPEQSDILTSTPRRSSWSVREQRLMSEVESSSQAIQGLRSKIQDLDNQLTEAQNTIAQQEGLLRLADADVFIAQIKDQDKVIAELKGQITDLESKISESKLEKSTFDREFLLLLQEKDSLAAQLESLKDDYDNVIEASRQAQYSATPMKRNDLSMFTQDEESLPNTPLSDIGSPLDFGDIDDIPANTPYRTPSRRRRTTQHDELNGSIQECASSPLAGSSSPIKLNNTSPLAQPTPAKAFADSESQPNTPFKTFDEYATMSPIVSTTPSRRLSIKDRVQEMYSSTVPAMLFVPKVEDASEEEPVAQEPQKPAVIDEAVAASEPEQQNIQSKENESVEQQNGDDASDEATQEMPVDQRAARVRHSVREIIYPSTKGSTSSIENIRHEVPSHRKAAKPRGFSTLSLIQNFVSLLLIVLLYISVNSSGRLQDGWDRVYLSDILRDAFGLTISGGM